MTSRSWAGAKTFVAGEQRLVPYNITGLSVNRYIHDPSDWTKSQWIAPLGASGHPGSPHYADQVCSKHRRTQIVMHSMFVALKYRAACSAFASTVF